jgi:acetyl esterase/lipase
MAAYMRTSYGSDPHQVVDHYFPLATVAPKPVHITLVHGGGWTAGDTQYGIMPYYAQALTALGYTVTSVGYRLAGAGVGWPAQVADITTGIGWARAKLGAGGALIVLGESAGGHLAAMLSLAPSSLPIAGLIALYGAHDLQALDLDTPGHPWSTQPAVTAALRACLEGVVPWEDPVKAALGSPDYLAVIATGALPRVLLVHSTDDPMIGAEQSRRLQRSLVARGFGSSVSLLEIPGTAHSGPTFEAPPVSNLVTAFIGSFA